MNPIDSIRGIFALLIVWHHYHPIHYHYNFGDTIVLFFFILSGFHIAITWKDKIHLAISSLGVVPRYSRYNG